PDPFAGKIQPASGGVDDAKVGLVGDEHGDVVEREPDLADGLGGGVAHDLDGEAEYFLAVHLEVGPVFREQFGRFGHEPAPAWNVEVLVSCPVGPEHGRKQAAWFFGRLDHHRAGAVAEEDAGAAIRVVDIAGEGIDADDEHAL